MDLVTILATYFLIWWVSLFLVLPRGNLSTASNPKKGHDIGAPENPDIKRKFIINTVLSFFIWSTGYAIILIFNINLKDILP